MLRILVALTALNALVAAGRAEADVAAGSTDPAAVARLVERADIQRVRGQCASAIETYREAIAASPHDAALHNKLAICHQTLDALGSARTEYARALELDPDYAAAWNNLGALHHTRGHYDRALECYRESLAREERARTYKNLGTAYLAADRVEEAFEAYRKAFELDPDEFRGDSVGTVAAPGADLAKQNYYFAKLSAAAGLTDQALGYIERALAAGFDDVHGLRADPAFEQVVADPRFEQLVRSSI